MSGRLEHLKTNGFLILRSLLDPDEAVALGHALSQEVPAASIGKSIPDACNKLAFARAFIFDPRLQEAVRGVIPEPKFLQVSDVQLLHNRDNWHRDSACRVFGAADWEESAEPYALYKIIVYLDCANAGLGVLPGSHKARVTVDRDHLEDFTVLEGDVDRALVEGGATRQYVAGMRSGDAIVFDERLLHCGRRFRSDGGLPTITSEFTGPKKTISYVFGPEGRHAWRFHSYFRHYRKELRFRQMPAPFCSRLEDAGLLPSFLGRNLFEEHPAELDTISGK